jgi:hypothetical protein
MKKIAASLLIAGVAVFGASGVAGAAPTKSNANGRAAAASNGSTATVTGPSVSGKVQNTKVTVVQANVAGNAKGGGSGAAQSNGNVNVTVNNAGQ